MVSREDREMLDDIELDRNTLNSEQDFSGTGNSFRMDRSSSQGRNAPHHQALYDSQFTDSHFKINQTRT